jgi:hypothetical protein
VGVGHFSIRGGVNDPEIIASASDLSNTPASTRLRICKIMPSDLACDAVGVGHIAAAFLGFFT